VSTVCKSSRRSCTPLSALIALILLANRERWYARGHHPTDCFSVDQGRLTSTSTSLGPTSLISAYAAPEPARRTGTWLPTE
jgi:hypothetical protein